ncbi:MAG: tRNA lysidine(34) synthetase TilS [Silicimonas sp.]|nr:tRNA lysidine(34) synthetase TilS [Silicimonas sp.]
MERAVPGSLDARARELGIERGTRLGVAVSGGSDSLAMLVLLHEAGWALEAATVDHGLRPEAAAEAAFVARTCAERNIPHATLRVDLTGAAGNLQDNARRARYGALRDWARERCLRYVALGHTMDDDAETFLMRVARGSGLDGLSGMSGRVSDGDLTWLRPFLSCRREELRKVLRAWGTTWVEDPSNEDEGFERVRMRKALQVLEPLGITPDKIRAVTENLSRVRADLDMAAKAAFEAAGEEQNGDVVLHFPEFRVSAGGNEVIRRSFAAALRWVSGADYAPRSEALMDMIEALRTGETRTLHGCIVTSGREVRIAREYNAVRDLEVPTRVAWDGRWVLDGPHADDLAIRALGEAVKDTPWRETGMPRHSLIASPAIWRGEALVAAPLAGLANGWTAKATGRGKFTDFLISR